MATTEQGPVAQPVKQELQDLPETRESMVARGLDAVALATLRIADRFDARARARGTSASAGEVKTPGTDLILWNGEVEEATTERESRGRKLLNRLGRGAGVVLAATGELKKGILSGAKATVELTAGAAILGANGAKRAGEATLSGVKTAAEVAGRGASTAAEAIGRGAKAAGAGIESASDTFFGAVDRQLTNADNRVMSLVDRLDTVITDRKNTAAENKKARTEKRAARIQAKEKAAEVARKEKERKAEVAAMYEDAYADNAAFDKNAAEWEGMYKDAYAENDRFDQAKEREALKEQARIDREKAKQDRIAAIAKRKENRRNKRTALKNSVTASANSAIASTGRGLNSAARGAAQLGRRAGEKVRDTATSTAEKTWSAVETAAERVKGRVDEIRAVGAAAVEAAQLTKKSLRDQRSLEK